MFGIFSLFLLEMIETVIKIADYFSVDSLLIISALMETKTPSLTANYNLFWDGMETAAPPLLF